ncbi:MAG: hypothetical protein F4Z51_08250 [Chloroflexi bacterium]|nr:hypothetical protein [Chloroflexota bacterium]MYD17321.1 hypothetical protein [Chloroflexota bacterium]
MPTLNVQNRTLFHGDNLPFLRGINSGTIHLIATDPPFNKGRDFHATPDSLAAGAKFEDRWSWDKDVHQDWIDAIQDDWPAVWEVIDAANSVWAKRDMGAFLCWLGVRMLEMHRVLREDGSIYLHIDHTAHAWVKALMDAIFGWKNFRNEIVWCYALGGSSRKLWSKKHDTLLFYSKSDSYYFDKPSIAATSQRMKGQDKGMLDWWTDIPSLNNMAKERMGYPTQKPLALYERVIQASSREGEFVLDPFCGCATTPIAAERAGRQWIGMDIWDKAHDVVVERLQREGLASPEGDTGGRLLTFGQIGYSTVAPVRSDDGGTAAPVLKTKQKIAEPPGPRMSRAEMVEFLIEQNGMVCRGCDRDFDDPLYLELDHNTPRSDGGLNHISNRLLLCGPCNRIKSNRLTLSGLRAENQKRGRMAME